ncbi:D-alanyl-D-alanine carboxypeptidase [Streptomyces bathyalis]|uniref:D-alanyl-D-alanine carboxypeptidase n=2 Tax=Streptomyces bathyalis TaxID=2710756 RepID=A0A7T1WVM7_9ACTN|nr:D-alanyl-D-alanine carboxypeptidase [Streptomyces bathyalis]
MFRTVRPGSDDSASATDSEEAARRAERMTAAFFGSGKPSETEEAGGKAEEAEESEVEKAEATAEATADATAEAQGADAAADSPGEPERSRSAGGDERSTGKAEPEPDAGEPEPDAEKPKADAAKSEADAEKSEADAGKPEPEESGDGSGKREEPAGEGQRSGKAAKAGKPADEADKAGKPSDKADKAGEPAGKAASKAAGSVDQPTTAFRVQPDAAGDGPKGSGEESGSAGGRVDQPTTAFRTVEPPERAEAGGAEASAGSEASADDRSADDESADDKKDADAKPAKPAKPVDPRIAPLPKAEGAGKKTETETEGDADTGTESGSGTAKPESASPSGKTSPSKTEPAKPGPAKPEPAESDSERTSQFVPLRSADAPPRPTREPDVVVPPKPEGSPTAGALPPEVEAPKLSEAELTRQQVRPDQAPIDLLAQLTNTPPKPETPLRTAVRRVKIWTPLAVLLVILFAIAQAVRPLPEPELSLSASPTYNFQGPKPSVPWPSEGQAALDVQGLGSFGTSGKQKPVPIASVAKVMTAYVILRDHPVKKGSKGAKIPVDKKAEKEAGLSAQNESTVEVKKGDTLSEQEAVQAVMIASANNVARLLARWDAGSEKAFAKKMNAAAKDLGMKNTKYTDPSGLTASTVSTASDQVKLAKKAMAIDLFRETVRMPGYTDTKGDQHGNWNKLVPLDGVVGIKTGTTTKAGGNLLFAAEKKVGGTEQLIVGAVLGQYQPSILDTVLRESKKLIDTAQDSLRAQKVVQKGEVVGYVDDQLGGKTPVVASRDVSAVGWSGLKVRLGLTDGGKALPHEGKAGDRAGTLTIGDGPGQVRVPVTLKDDMTEPGFGAKLTRIL